MRIQKTNTRKIFIINASFFNKLKPFPAVAERGFYSLENFFQHTETPVASVRVTFHTLNIAV
jgi:hypothetical protein